MCTEIHLPQSNGPDMQISRLSEVEPALGVKPIILADAPSMPDDCCLCPCDIEATAEAAGYLVEGYDEWGNAVLTCKG